jgi:hypothetical protein
MNRLRWATLAIGTFFGFGAIYHAIQLASPAANDSSPPWRHALFLAINAFFSLTFALRWRWLWIPCSLLIFQQGYSHGKDFVVALQAGELDVKSLLVLLFLPAVAWVSVEVWKAKSRSSPPVPPPEA